MHPQKLEPVVNYDSFRLPFVHDIDANGVSVEDESGEYEKTSHLEAMRDQIPSECIFLGAINFEIPHSPGLTWDIDYYYYLMRWTDSDYDWALFRITWEDNCGRYEWHACARVKGVSDHQNAARLMFKGVMDSLGFDLDDEDLEEDYAPYREFLEGV